MAGALPYMQLYVADYLADCAHLSTLEHGAYLLLMFNYWQRGESFKAKDEQTLNKRLTSVTRLSNEEWLEIKETLQEFFNFVEHDDYVEWRHDRIERDLAAVREKSEKASLAGKHSASARKNKKILPVTNKQTLSDCLTEDQQTFNERLTDAQQTFNHTEADTDTDNNKDKSLLSTKTKNRKFSMFENWLPHEKTWKSICVRSGIALTECTEDALQEFILYWINAPDDLNTQGQWEHKLAKDLIRKRRFTEARRNASNNQTNQPDTGGIEHTATDTSWRDT